MSTSAKCWMRICNYGCSRGGVSLSVPGTSPASSVPVRVLVTMTVSGPVSIQVSTPVSTPVPVLVTTTVSVGICIHGRAMSAGTKGAQETTFIITKGQRQKKKTTQERWKTHTTEQQHKGGGRCERDG